MPHSLTVWLCLPVPCAVPRGVVKRTWDSKLESAVKMVVTAVKAAATPQVGCRDQPSLHTLLPMLEVLFLWVERRKRADPCSPHLQSIAMHCRHLLSSPHAFYCCCVQALTLAAPAALPAAPVAQRRPCRPTCATCSKLQVTTKPDRSMSPGLNWPWCAVMAPGQRARLRPSLPAACMLQGGRRFADHLWQQGGLGCCSRRAQLCAGWPLPGHWAWRVRAPVPASAKDSGFDMLYMPFRVATGSGPASSCATRFWTSSGLPPPVPSCPGRCAPAPLLHCLLRPLPPLTPAHC